MADMPDMSDVNAPLYPNAVVLPTLALIAVILDAPCFFWYIQNRNLAAASLVFWIVLANFINFVNALIWPRDNISQWFLGYGLCDVEVKLEVAGYVAGIGSIICIHRNLARVLDTENTIIQETRKDRRKRLLLELWLCFGFPVFMMFLHYVVQPNRYNIYAIVGCATNFHNSWPSIVLIYIWPLILCIIATYYASK